MILAEKNKQPVMVTIKCCTFNHEPYIRDCLEGFVMQKTNFKFEAIVHDDASTDGTAAIIKEYAEKYPDIIKPILETENQYSKHDGSLDCIMLKHMHGKYIAYCEGDDCWIDPLKLQKQVDYMEAHPDCVLTHTDMDVKNVTTGEILHDKWKVQRNFNLIRRNFGKRLIPLILQGKYSVTTLTACVRKETLQECYDEGLMEFDPNLLMSDTNLWMCLASKGYVYLIPDCCACYHVIPESATHSKNYSNIISFYVSCLYMIDTYSKKLSVSDKDKEIAKQLYIFFLLRDVYTDKREYLQELKDRILKGNKLNVSNSLLLKTMNSGRLIKRMILDIIRIHQYVSHLVDFYLAKYFGII